MGKRKAIALRENDEALSTKLGKINWKNKLR